jgi:serine/threonine-protein kinase
MISCSGCGALCSENARLCPSCGRAISIPDKPTLEPGGTAAGSPPIPVRSHLPQSGGFSPGTVLIERYRIVALLGRGGMGEVYRAEDLKLGNVVALKFLPASLQNDAAVLAGFHAEVRNARQVSHPNVCRYAASHISTLQTGLQTNCQNRRYTDNPSCTTLEQAGSFPFLSQEKEISDGMSN